MVSEPPIIPRRTRNSRVNVSEEELKRRNVEKVQRWRAQKQAEMDTLEQEGWTVVSKGARVLRDMEGVTYVEYWGAWHRVADEAPPTATAPVLDTSTGIYR